MSGRKILPFIARWSFFNFSAFQNTPIFITNEIVIENRKLVIDSIKIIEKLTLKLDVKKNVKEKPTLSIKMSFAALVVFLN